MRVINIKKGNWGKIKAFFSVSTDDGFVIKGFKIVESVNGLFVSLPSQKGKDEKYYPGVYLNPAVRQRFEDCALEAYESNKEFEIKKTELLHLIDNYESLDIHDEQIPQKYDMVDEGGFYDDDEFQKYYKI